MPPASEFCRGVENAFRVASSSQVSIDSPGSSLHGHSLAVTQECIENLFKPVCGSHFQDLLVKFLTGLLLTLNKNCSLRPTAAPCHGERLSGKAVVSAHPARDGLGMGPAPGKSSTDFTFLARILAVFQEQILLNLLFVFGQFPVP